MRVRKNEYIEKWETVRQAELKELVSKGIVPWEHDLDVEESNPVEDGEGLLKYRRYLMGNCAALVNEQKPAKEVVDEFVNDAVAWIQKGNGMVAKL